MSLKELLSVSIDLAATGGSNVRRIQERALRDSKNDNKENALNAKSKGLTKEGAKEVVTEGDLNSHRAIVYGFNKAFPGEGILSLRSRNDLIGYPPGLTVAESSILSITITISQASISYRRNTI